MKHNTLHYGNNILESKAAVLEKFEISNLVAQCKSLKMQHQIEQLRKVKNVDNKAYRYLKQRLPYFVCAEFKNNIRLSANFISTQYLVLDIDKYGNTDEVALLKQKIIKDPRVFVAFISPGGEGLKLLFQLAQPMVSLKNFSDFYKSFSRSFATQYQLEEHLDFSTNDATRICFLSFDAQCYYNQNPVKLDCQLYTSHLFTLMPEKMEQENTADEPNLTTTKAAITNKQYKDILSTLNPKTPRPKKKYIVPVALKNIQPKIFNAFQKQGLEVTEFSEISYGLKIFIKDKEKFAVVNLYHGKNGFSTVKNKVRNSCEALLEVSAAIIENIIYTNEEEKYTSQNDRLDEEDQRIRFIKLKTAR